MQKSELKNGMVVELRGEKGLKYLVINDSLVANDGYLYLSDFTENLKFEPKNEEWDIVKIFDTPSWGLGLTRGMNEATLIWKREEALFKVGDIVTGKPNNGYGVTTSEAIMEVIDIDEEDETMEVKVLSTSNHINHCWVGRNYYVDQNLFVLTSLIVKEVTMADLEKKYGCKVKVVN